MDAITLGKKKKKKVMKIYIEKIGNKKQRMVYILIYRRIPSAKLLILKK
jgi:hypothetical protein